MSYCPFDCLLQSAATFWIVPPGWVATNQLRVTGPPVPELPQPAAAMARPAIVATPRGLTLSQRARISLLLPWFGLALSYPGQIACKPRPDLTEQARYLTSVGERLREAIGGRLVGVYAGGSYALGDYLPGRSDLDVAAVVRPMLGHEAADALVARLRHDVLRCPARGLELVVYREETASSGCAASDFELNLNTAERAPASVQSRGAAGDIGSHWFAIDRSVLAEAGVSLLGPSAGEVFAAIPADDLRPVLAESIRWYTAHAADPSDAVLNACRALRYSEVGTWLSKPAAGAWVVARGLAPEDLVSRAIAARTRHADIDEAEVTEFLRAAEARLGRAGT